MSSEDEKRIMFEIYRDAADGGRYRVVYFTELGEREREAEISRAANGEHLFDGYILSRERWEAKQAVERILDQLNKGTAIDLTYIETELKSFMG